jgi:hypothetical protein
MPKSGADWEGKRIGIPTTLFLTKSDIALIKATTGVEIDYDTGEVKNDDPKAFDFIQSLTDLRYEDFARAQPPKEELTADDLREVFKNAAVAGKPLNPDYLTEALKWFDSMKSSGSAASDSDAPPPPGKTVGTNVDMYA